MSLREDNHSVFQYTYGGKPVYYNCPFSSDYHDVVTKNMDLLKAGVKLLDPAIPIFDIPQTILRLYEYLSAIFPSITKKEVQVAVTAGVAAQQQYRGEVRAKGEAALDFMKTSGRPGVVVAGRPYHMDQVIGSPIIPNLLQTSGYVVFTADSIAHLGKDIVETMRLNNFYLNDAEIISAAKFVARRVDIALVHVVSFGCSLTPETDDEIKVTFLVLSLSLSFFPAYFAQPWEASLLC